MTKLDLTLAAAIVLVPLAVLATPSSAATAHNSQAGGFGATTNSTSSTVSSRRIKHAAKHRKM